MKENNIGKKVIVRTYSAGVFYGTLKRREEQEVELENCRRIWYWRGAASLSELAVAGVTNPKGCKFSVNVPSIEVLQAIEIIPCTEDAIESIEAVPVWSAR